MSKYILWDLDETLIDSERNLIKPGIEKTLENLSKLGFENIIASSGTQKHVELCLKVSKLKKYFSRIFSREVISMEPKHYLPVLKELNITQEYARKNLIIIGDNREDAPGDVNGIVSVEDEYQIIHKSVLLEKLIHFLLKKSSGEFNKAFDKMYSEGVLTEELAPDLSSLGNKWYMFNNDVKLVLNYQTNNQRHPVYGPHIQFYNVSKKYCVRGPKLYPK